MKQYYCEELQESCYWMEESEKRGKKIATLEARCAELEKEQCPHDYGLLKEIEAKRFPEAINRISELEKRLEDAETLAVDAKNVAEYFNGSIIKNPRFARLQSVRDSMDRILSRTGKEGEKA